MVNWKEYVLSVVAASLICGILTQMFSGCVKKELLRLICGVVLTVLILQPVSRLRLEDLLMFPVLSPESAEEYLNMGESTAAAVRKQYIKDACEAYIFNKAKAMGTEISAEFFLSEECLPVFVKIEGTVKPAVQKELERILTVDLGITKENQQWTGNPENRGS